MHEDSRGFIDGKSLSSAPLERVYWKLKTRAPWASEVERLSFAAVSWRIFSDIKIVSLGPDDDWASMIRMFTRARLTLYRTLGKFARNAFDP